MTPKIKTNWHLYTPDLEISFPNMKSWIEEDNSLMNRLRLLETKIDLIAMRSIFVSSNLNLFINELSSSIQDFIFGNEISRSGV